MTGKLLQVGDVYGGKLRLLEVLKEWRGTARQYKVKCLICESKGEPCEYITSKVSLIRGGVKCACTTSTPRPVKETTKLIEEMCKHKNYTFLGFVDGNKGHDKIKLYCNTHGTYWETTRISHFLRGHGGRCCAVTGYSVLERGYLYVLEVNSSDGSFIGYGITNNLDNRLKIHNNILKKANCDVVSIASYETTGLIAQKVERDIKHTFANYRQEILSFKTEALCTAHLKEVKLFIEDSISKYESKENDSLDSEALKHIWYEPSTTSDKSHTYSDSTIPLLCSSTSHS